MPLWFLNNPTTNIAIYFRITVENDIIVLLKKVITIQYE